MKDGHGIVLLRDHVAFGVISGRPGKASEARLRELRFKHLVFGERDKLAGYARLAHLGIPDEEVAYMGDDVNDVPLLRRVGLSACPADALPEVTEAVHLVTRASGRPRRGPGAVRAHPPREGARAPLAGGDPSRSPAQRARAGEGVCRGGAPGGTFPRR